MGKRGPKKGAIYKPTIDKALQREVLRGLIAQELPELTKAQLLHAKGVRHTFMRDSAGRFVQLTDPKQIEAALNSGEEGKYYWTFTKDPSMQAFSYLVDQLIDKAPQHVAVSGEDGGPIVIKWEE